jgi:hypothetical protein
MSGIGTVLILHTKVAMAYMTPSCIFVLELLAFTARNFVVVMDILEGQVEKARSDDFR